MYLPFLLLVVGVTLSCFQLHSQHLNSFDPIVLKTPLNTVNSTMEEYAPIISLDGKTLFFCREYKEREIIYTADYLDSIWGNVRPIDGIKGGANKAPLAISSDGTQLFLFENGKIKVSNKEQDNWSKPAALDSTINAYKWQGGVTLSSDNKILIFAARGFDSNSGQVYQHTDFFISFWQETGSWTSPVNLSESINTPLQERSPFLHPDGKTLYFSSEGHEGYGDLDVFKTTRLDDTWLKWSLPVNLGKEINTSGEDWGYTISTDGELAFFASSSKDNTDQDIYMLNLPEEFQPNEVSVIKGKLYFEEDSSRQATITIEDLDSKTVVSKTQTDPQTGSYYMIFPERKLYAYTIEKDGYFPVAGHLDLHNLINHVTISKDVKLVPLEKMKKENIALPITNLFFDTGKATIQNSSFFALNRLALLVKQQDISIILEGHTDDVGSDLFNLKLSHQRAEAVKNYLIEAGCPSENITTLGFGDSRPSHENTSEEGRSKNRRVELRISK